MVQNRFLSIFVHVEQHLCLTCSLSQEWNSLMMSQNRERSSQLGVSSSFMRGAHAGRGIVREHAL